MLLKRFLHIFIYHRIKGVYGAVMQLFFFPVLLFRRFRILRKFLFQRHIFRLILISVLPVADPGDRIRFPDERPFFCKQECFSFCFFQDLSRRILVHVHVVGKALFLLLQTLSVKPLLVHLMQQIIILYQLIPLDILCQKSVFFLLF